MLSSSWEGSDAASERDDVDSGSGTGGHQGVFAVVRCSGVGLVGERGTGMPNASIAELSIEIDFSMSITFEYSEWVTPAFNGRHTPQIHPHMSLDRLSTFLRYAVPMAFLVVSPVCTMGRVLVKAHLVAITRNPLESCKTL